jgi:transposase
MTLLRLVQQLPLPDAPTPTVLGVDDWAQRKRHTYGTILVDHQRQGVVDLLPDRTAETLAAWLRAHPGVEIVTRDRAGAFAEGIRRGAPAAEQVADAFHVIVNLRDTLERIVQRHPEAVRAAGDEVAPAPPAPKANPSADPPGVRRLTAPERQHQARRARRMARYEAVRQLVAQGIGLRAIGRQLHLARKTVRTFARAATFPERQPRRQRPTTLTPFEPYLRQRWAEGCHTATVLYQEVRARGFRGSDSAFAGHLKRWREAPGAEATRLPVRPKPLSARQVSWVLLRRNDELTADERAQREAVLRHSPALRSAADLAQRFRATVRDRAAHHWTRWLVAAERSDSPEWRGFARSLRLDSAATGRCCASPGATAGPRAPSTN